MPSFSHVKATLLRVLCCFDNQEKQPTIVRANVLIHSVSINILQGPPMNVRKVDISIPGLTEEEYSHSKRPNGTIAH